MAASKFFRALSILLISSMLIGCSDSGGGGSSQAPSQNVNDIAVAVFEYQIKYHVTSHQQVVFLMMDGQDPTQEVMAAFEGRTLKNHEGAELSVKRLSESEWIPPQDSPCGRPVDIETGIPGIVFEFSDLNWLSNSTTTAWGGHIASCTGGFLGTFTLEWTGENWAVESFIPEVAF